MCASGGRVLSNPKIYLNPPKDSENIKQTCSVNPRVCLKKLKSPKNKRVFPVMRVII